ncbi:MAG: TadE/TadG family type IV pilus assembly protein [Alphaproteobacteria bacterium]
MVEDRRGSAAVEFGLIAPLFILMIVGIVEVGTTLFVGALMEGAIRDASRYGITGQDGANRAQVIRDIIEERTIGLVDINIATIQTQVYESFEAVGSAEPYTDDNPANGTYDVGEAFVDVNQNSQWDSDQGKDGVGEPGEIVLYTVDYNLPMLTGYVASHLGSGGHIGLSASIAVLNEPFIDDPAVQ